VIDIKQGGSSPDDVNQTTPVASATIIKKAIASFSFIPEASAYTGHPYSATIRSQVVEDGQRVPASISRYSVRVTSSRPATWAVKPKHSRSRTSHEMYIDGMCAA
jgi:hypothetical protein